MPKTNKPTIRIHDLETNEVIDREMNDAEFTQYKADKAAAEVAAEVAANAKAKADADKAALLARLGLTEDEAKLLLS